MRVRDNLAWPKGYKPITYLTEKDKSTRSKGFLMGTMDIYHEMVDRIGSVIDRQMSNSAEESFNQVCFQVSGMIIEAQQLHELLVNAGYILDVYPFETEAENIREYRSNAFMNSVAWE